MHTLETLKEQVRSRLEPGVKAKLYSKKKNHGIRFLTLALICAILIKILLNDDYSWLGNLLYLPTWACGFFAIVAGIQYLITDTSPSYISLYETNHNLTNEELGILLNIELSDLAISIIQETLSTENDISYYTIEDIIDQDTYIHNIKHGVINLQNRGIYTTEKQQQNLDKLLHRRDRVVEYH